MVVYQIETRYKDCKSIIITASYERTRKELDTAEERNVDVIVTPYILEDFDDGIVINKEEISSVFLKEQIKSVRTL